MLILLSILLYLFLLFEMLSYCTRNANRLADAMTKKPIFITLNRLLSIINKISHSCFSEKMEISTIARKLGNDWEQNET